MLSITTAIVLFIFVCIIFPQLVKNRPQFYLAIASVVLIMLVQCLMSIFGGSINFVRFLLFLDTILNLTAFLLMILSTGGLSLGELTGEFADAFDAVRKGPDAHKPIVVPLTGAKPGSRAAEAESHVYTIPDPAAAPRTVRPDDEGAIPLE